MADEGTSLGPRFRIHLRLPKTGRSLEELDVSRKMVFPRKCNRCTAMTAIVVDTQLGGLWVVKEKVNGR